MNSRTLTRMAVALVSITIAAYVTEHRNDVQAQRRPDLTGTWKLNLSKSKTQDGSLMTELYDSFVMTIDHREPQLNIEQNIVQEGSRRIVPITVTTDGKETKSKILNAPATASAKWDGDTLSISLRRELAEGGYVESIRTLRVSPDGKTMSAKVTINPAGIVGDEVWEKQ
jgi:hypothetical protein